MALVFQSCFKKRIIPLRNRDFNASQNIITVVKRVVQGLDRDPLYSTELAHSDKIFLTIDSGSNSKTVDNLEEELHSTTSVAKDACLL
jgi:hypothetical protein